ncbi:hypothetical protein Nepgr_017837 [Nepenthes gracilis]|uniref:Uncharacterized protein n=1 Tax=Nepenthes gracilis TaxID=150966 RepID=A0AAD3STG2_NEPGR|nr:hypothetical protein Nepgr_017837 [Nepenthes gracilis]
MATQSTEDHGEARDEDQTTMVEEDRDRKDSDIVTDLSLSSSSFDDESAASDGSSCSSEACDDASSSSSSSKSNGTVYDLSELIAQLPIKRGLSKYYNGKSESFTSLARVTSIEDLEKKAPIPYKRKLKARDVTPRMRIRLDRLTGVGITLVASRRFPPRFSYA